MVWLDFLLLFRKRLYLINKIRIYCLNLPKVAKMLFSFFFCHRLFRPFFLHFSSHWLISTHFTPQWPSYFDQLIFKLYTVRRRFYLLVPQRSSISTSSRKRFFKLKFFNGLIVKPDTIYIPNESKMYVFYRNGNNSILVYGGLPYFRTGTAIWKLKEYRLKICRVPTWHP